MVKAILQRLQRDDRYSIAINFETFQTVYHFCREGKTFNYIRNGVFRKRFQSIDLSIEKKISMKSQSIKDKLFSLSILFFFFPSPTRRNQFAFFDRLIPSPPSKTVQFRHGARRNIRNIFEPTASLRLSRALNHLIELLFRRHRVFGRIRCCHFDRGISIGNRSINGNRRDDTPRNEIQSRIINCSPG